MGNLCEEFSKTFGSFVLEISALSTQFKMVVFLFTQSVIEVKFTKSPKKD